MRERASGGQPRREVVDGPRAARPARRARRPGGSPACAPAPRGRGPASTASIRAIVSSSGITLPQIDSSAAMRSARADGLSSPMTSPALVWARARAISASSKSRGGAGQLVGGQVDQLADLVAAGAGIDRHHAGLGPGRALREDGVAEAALLARLLEQPRGHAAAERHRRDLRRVVVVVAIAGRLEAPGRNAPAPAASRRGARRRA